MEWVDLNKNFAMNNSTGILLFFILLTVLISGCSGGAVFSGSTPTDPETSAKDVEISPTVDICTPLNIPDIAFPRQEPLEGERAKMEAELVGDLVLSKGCLYIVFGEG
jgi:hypothetical protein